MLFAPARGKLCFASPMDPRAVLSAFDEQVRRQTALDMPDELVELDERVLVRVAPHGGWTGVTWSSLREQDADDVIAEQVLCLSALGREWEWKHYSYDTPADLPRRLLAHGFIAEQPEALLFAEADTLDVEASPAPTGIDLVRVRDARGAHEVVRLGDEIFGEASTGLEAALLAALSRTPPTACAYLAIGDGAPVAALRAEFLPGCDFGSLWGAATQPAWRKRGAFRALVACAASDARERGVRYLQTDAMPTSQPVLERLGFMRLASTTPYKHPAGGA